MSYRVTIEKRPVYPVTGTFPHDQPYCKEETIVVEADNYTTSSRNFVTFFRLSSPVLSLRATDVVKVERT